MAIPFKVLDTRPPTLGNIGIKSSGNFTNAFIRNSDGEMVDLDALLGDVTEAVEKADPNELLRLILIEMRAQSHMLAAAFSLSDPVETYRTIEQTDE